MAVAAQNNTLTEIQKAFSSVKQQFRFEILLLLVLNLIAVGRFFSFNASASADWVYWTKNSLSHYSSFPSWSGLFNLGQSDMSLLTRGPLNAAYWYLVKVLGNADFFNRLLWFIPLPIFGTVGSYLLSNKLLQNRVAAFTTALLFVINTEFIFRISEGHNLLLFGYALTPGVLWLLILGFEKRRLLHFLLAGCVLAFAFSYDLRTDFLMAIVIALFVVWYFLFEKTSWNERYQFYLKALACLLAVPVLVFPFFILPALFTGGPSLPATYTSLADLKSFSYADLTHSLTLYDSFWPIVGTDVKNVVPSIFLLLPLLAFLALWLRKHDIYVAFFALIYAVGVFLAKGVNDPLGNVNQWFFLHVPGFFAFREATKFYLLVAFGLSFLVGVAVKELADRIKNLTWLQKRSGSKQVAVMLFLAGALAVFVVMMKPAFFQEVQGNFVSFQLPQWQKQLDAAQAADSHFYRTLWIPGKENISPFSDAHPIMSGEELDQPGYGMRPFVQLGDASPTLHWSALHNPATPDLLRLAGVKYIYVPNTDYHKGFLDPFAAFMGKSPAQLQAAKNFLDSQSWLRPSTVTTNLIPAYSIANSQDHFFTTAGRIYVSGPDDFFAAFDSLPNVNFASQTIVPLDERTVKDVLPGSTLVLNQQSLNDFILSRLPDTQLIAPSAISKLPGIPTDSSIWNAGNLDDKYSLSALNTKIQNYDFDYGKGFIYASKPGQTSLKLDVPAQEATGTHLWLRALDNPLGSSLIITVENQTLKLDIPPTGNSNFHWYDLGAVNLSAGTHNVTVTANSGLNVINVMALLNDSDFATAKSHVDDLLKQEQVVQIEKFNSVQFKQAAVDQQTGTTTWAVPIAGTYRPSVHIPAGARATSLQLTVDGQNFKFDLTVPEATDKTNQGLWYDLPALKLKQGTHQVMVTVNGATQNSAGQYVFPLDYLVLNSGTQTFTQLLQSQTAPASLSYDFVSPTQYVVHIKNATRPFDLIFDEAYDSNWQAYYQGVKGQNPDKAYEMVQAYHINTLGSYDVTIEYRPQKFVDIGLILSAVGVLIVITALIVFWRKRW